MQNYVALDFIDVRYLSKHDVRYILEAQPGDVEPILPLERQLMVERDLNRSVSIIAAKEIIKCI